MSAKTIYDRLRSHGMTIAGACAMLGNMQAESGLKANIAQRGMTTLTDDEYTRQADSYAISQAKFVHDAVGYGLCQWTYWSRKKALAEYAHDIGKSVGDEAMQVDFCVGELKASYASLWSFLCTTEVTYEATSRICTEYERPAVNNINARYGFAQKFQSELADGAAPATDDRDVDYVILALQSCMAHDGYWPKNRLDGVKTRDFCDKLLEYAQDVGRC